LRKIESLEESLFFPKEIELAEIYQFAADMGGAGFVFTGENDSDIMHNSALINLNLLGEYIKRFSIEDNKRPKVFYSSSACMYPSYNQEDPANPNCREDSAYPAHPDSEYGWEKLFSERLFLAYERNYGVPVKIARYHNIFGPLGTWDGGREKAPAAICRKVLLAKDEGEIEIWGDGDQTRSFLFIDDCIEATLKLVRNEHFAGPVNIGSEEMVTINQLVNLVSTIANKRLRVTHIPGPIGVRGRNSDNELIWNELKWKPDFSLSQGIELTLPWIEEQILASKIKIQG
jgi:nucleoside-diphosphate-sugar epimerase